MPATNPAADDPVTGDPAADDPAADDPAAGSLADDDPVTGGRAGPAPRHRHAARARSFGGAAELYERARPTYPAAVAEDLGAGPGVRVLDVGSGTGKVGRLFRDLGCEVLGVEADERMAAVGRRCGLEIEIGRFEDWDDAGRRFDLVVSGQAWHWVDPIHGATKAASLLRRGGRLAPFWNFRRPFTGELRRRLDACYERHAPEIATPSGTGSGSRGHEEFDLHAGQLRASDRFSRIEVRRYPWATCYTTAQWCELIATHSDHRLLGPERLAALVGGVGEVLDDLGGQLDVTYETVVIEAQVSQVSQESQE